MARQTLKLPLVSRCARGKIRYYSRLVAEEHRASLEKNDKLNNPHLGPLVVYECRYCGPGCFHVGHQTI